MWNAIADSPVFWLGLIGGLAALWLLPVIIGLARHAQPVIVIILLIVFPLLWPAALLGAFMLPRKEDAFRPAGTPPYWSSDGQEWRASPPYHS